MPTACCRRGSRPGHILDKRVERLRGVLLETKVVGMQTTENAVSVTFEGTLPDGMARGRRGSRAGVDRAQAELRGARPRTTGVVVTPRGSARSRARRTRTHDLCDWRRVGETMMEHKASHEARSRSMRSSAEGRVRALAIPAVVSPTRDRVVRATEADAAKQGAGHRPAVPVGRVGRASPSTALTVWTKLVVDPKTSESSRRHCRPGRGRVDCEGGWRGDGRNASALRMTITRTDPSET